MIPGVPEPPTTSDPLSWIAIALVAGVIVLVPVLLRFAREERREALSAFREEMAAQRNHDAQQVEKTHARIDGLAEKVGTLETTIAARQ